MQRQVKSNEGVTPFKVHENPTAKSRNANVWKQVKKEVQDVVDSYNKLELAPLSNNDFKRLFTDTNDLLFDKFAKGDISIGGFAVDKVKAMELIVKPPAYQELLREIEDARIKCSKGFQNGGTIITLQMNNIDYYFQLTDGINVTYAERLQTEIDSYADVYATTQQTQDIYSFLADVVEAYYKNGLDKYFPDKYKAERTPALGNYSVVIPKLCTIIYGTNHEDQSFILKPEYFGKVKEIHMNMDFQLGRS